MDCGWRGVECVTGVDEYKAGLYWVLSLLQALSSRLRPTTSCSSSATRSLNSMVVFACAARQQCGLGQCDEKQGRRREAQPVGDRTHSLPAQCKHIPL